MQPAGIDEALRPVIVDAPRQRPTLSRRAAEILGQIIRDAVVPASEDGDDQEVSS